MSLGKKVFTSAALLFIRKIWGNVLNLVVMAFLARLLSKEDFGLLAISSVFLSIINTMATSGIAEYIVYYDAEDRKEKINAAFWMNLLMTLAVVIIVVITGKWWGEFYGSDKVYGLLLLLSVSFFFEMGSMVPKTLLRKELEYKSLVYYSSISMTAVSIGKLGAAWFGFGVYSLALPQAIVSPFLMFSFFLKTNWKPYWNFGFKHFRPIFNYSKHIIGSRVLTKLVNEGDNIIVGKFVGLEGLGIYSLAFQLANLVTTNVVFLVNDIFLPLFNKVKNDIDRLRSLYIRMIRYLSFISFPLIALLVIIAEPLVYFIYGEKWLDAVLPFQILCAFALARSISSPSSSLFSAMGRPDIGFKFTVYFTPVFLLAVFIGSYYGVNGVAFSTSIVRVLGSIVSLSLSLNLIQLRLTNLFKTVKSNLIIAIAMIILFSWIHFISFGEERLPLLIITPFILYLNLFLLRVFFKNEFTLFLNDIETSLPIKQLCNLTRKILFLQTQSH